MQSRNGSERGTAAIPMSSYLLREAGPIRGCGLSREADQVQRAAVQT
jgi:hypothetical protein